MKMNKSLIIGIAGIVATSTAFVLRKLSKSKRTKDVADAEATYVAEWLDTLFINGNSADDMVLSLSKLKEAAEAAINLVKQGGDEL